MTQIDNDRGQEATGHALETLWMIMFESERLKDRLLFKRASELFKRELEVFWDDVYGGVLHSMQNVDKNLWGEIGLQKALWLQEEVLIGLMSIIEHTGEQWAKDWFSRLYSYVLDKFPLKQYG